MTTTEALKPSLTKQIREKVHTNQADGDRNWRNELKWSRYGEDVLSYETSFSTILDKSIYDLLKNKKTFLRVMDLMAPSETIATLFRKFPKRSKLGIAVSLEDFRNDEKKKRDERLGIEQISGDLMKSSTWDKIKRSLQGGKADLIMERAMAGFECFPKDPRFFAILLNKAWELLSKDSGILIAEVPSRFNIEAEKMIKGFRRNHNMDASAAKSDIDGCLYIKLVKTPNSPKKLPF